jgi:hypothetical protein
VSATFALLTTAACSTPAVSAPRSPPPVAAAATSEGTKVLATGAAFLTTSGGPGRGLTLQLRSASDGHVLRTVFTPAGSTTSLSVATAADGSVLVAENGRCGSRLIRLDGATGRQRTLRTIPDDVSDLVLDGAGTRIAYVTQPTCSKAVCPGACAGPAGFLPSVLVVMDLTTGRSTRTSTDAPGHPLWSLSWSPDGTQLVAFYDGNAPGLLRFDSRAPNFATATRIPTRPGCEYMAVTWTRTGIVAAESCGNQGLLSPGRLVETTPTGAVQASWPLPDCIDGLHLTSTPNGSGTLVEANIGYGNGACSTRQANGVSPLTRLAAIDGQQLRTVIDLRDYLEVRLAAY